MILAAGKWFDWWGGLTWGTDPSSTRLRFSPC